jgi:tetratricopeptide (TPR) repeat protein
MRALADGQYAEAQQQLTKARQLLPGNVSVLLGLAEVANRTGNTKVAEARLRDAVGENPDSADAQLAWSRFLFAEGRLDEALAAGERAVVLAPQSKTAHVDLAVLYSRGFGRYADAIPHYRAALDADPEMAGARFGLGVALARTGKSQDAEKELRAAAQLEPSNPLPYEELGRLYLERGASPQALAAYDSALKVDPKLTVAHLMRGDILARSGDTRAALASYQAALETSPDNAQAYLRIGMIEQSRRNWGDAERAYLKVVALDPKNALAFNNLASMATEQLYVNFPRALGWAKKAVELAPDIAIFQDTLGWVQRGMGDRDAALATLERAAQLRNATPVVIYHLGVVYDEMGRKSEALKAYKAALAANRNFSEAAQATKRVAELEDKN